MTNLKEPRQAAKTLLKGVQGGEAKACARARAVYRDLAEVSDGRVADDFGLMRAQHVVAKEHGYDNWKALKDNPPAAPTSPMQEAPTEAPFRRRGTLQEAPPAVEPLPRRSATMFLSGPTLEQAPSTSVSAATPTARRCVAFDTKIPAVEFKWTSTTDGEDREVYTYQYESEAEADYVVEQFTKWVAFLVYFGDEITDEWITDSIQCARRDRLLWRFCNAA